MKTIIVQFRADIVASGNSGRYRLDDRDSLILESCCPPGRDSFWIMMHADRWYIGPWSGRVYAIQNGDTSDYVRVCLELLKIDGQTCKLDEAMCNARNLVEFDYESIEF